MKYVKLFLKKLLRFLLKPLSFIPALLVMYCIFMFSSQDGTASGNLSYKVSKKIVVITDEVLKKNWNESQISVNTDKIHYYVRKGAHITEYFILAVSISFPLYVYGVRSIWLILVAGTFCIGFAGLDEYHQLFVSGRGSSKRDVYIDSIGVFSGIIITQFVCHIGRVTVFKPLSNKPKH